MGRVKAAILTFVIFLAALVTFLANSSTIAANLLTLYDHWFRGKPKDADPTVVDRAPAPQATSGSGREVVDATDRKRGLDLPLSTAGEEWQVVAPRDVASMAGNWCSTLGRVRLDLGAGRARYRMEPNGRGWVSARTWRFRQTLRLEPEGQQPLFFTHEGPDHLREVTRGDDGLNQIVRTSSILMWNCDRCLLDDAGMLTWCRGDREYDVIHAHRLAAGRSDEPDFIDVGNMQTDASVLLGRDTL